MSALVDIAYDADEAAEVHRRRMLAESDALLERVEELRLADQTVCPRDLADDVRSLQLRLGRVPADRPRTVRAAHHLVFAVQARLMAANPAHPRPRSLPGRPVGVPGLTVLRQGGAWKFLALPPPPPAVEPAAVAEWWNRVQLTVGRALDRWACAQDQAVSAARSREGAVCAVHRSRAAWRNYWELRCEVDRLMAMAAASRRDAAATHARARGPPGPAGWPAAGFAHADQCAIPGAREALMRTNVRLPRSPEGRRPPAADRGIQSSRCSRS
jgi:hypothetical protein